MGALEINVSSSTCRKCGTAYGRLKGYFPVSYGFLYKGTGYLPYCRDCVDSMYTIYLRASKDPRKAVRQMCRKLDLYWNAEIFESVERSNSTRSMMTNYITRVNNIKYSTKCYDDTLEEEGVMWLEPKEYNSRPVRAAEPKEDSDGNESGSKVIDVDPEVVDFWGSDFEPEFILKLDRRYKDWTEDLDQLDKGSISLFKQICILEETIARDAAMGKPVDKNINTLNTLLGSANLKPVQKDPSSSATDSTPMGVWIRRFENERPIPEPDPELEDVDGIIHYIQVFFLGHLAKMLGKNEVYSKLYEKEIARLRVDKPDVSDEYDDDEAFFEAAFENAGGGDDE